LCKNVNSFVLKEGKLSEKILPKTFAFGRNVTCSKQRRREYLSGGAAVSSFFSRRFAKKETLHVKKSYTSPEMTSSGSIAANTYNGASGAYT
jgi:hypothetical protein